jgi:hypothetical protein
VREEEIEAMLKTFNDIGDIIYDSSDPVLKQYVILQPQFLVDIIQSLISIPDGSGDHMSIHRHLLRDRGQLHYDLLRESLKANNETIVHVIRHFLVAKNLIISHSATIYSVPSMLPVNLPQDARDIPNINWDNRFFIDFGEQQPAIFIHRLIARLSRRPYKLVGQYPIMWRDGGLFTYHNHKLTFRLQTFHTSQGQYIVEVAMKTALSRNPLEFFHDLWTAMKAIQQKEFPKMWFVCGVQCPRMPPHDHGLITDDVNAVHVLKIASETAPLPNGNHLHLLCKARTVIVDLKKVCINCRYLEIVTLECSVIDQFGLIREFMTNVLIY